MKITEYFEEVIEMCKQNPEFRLGQAHFNVMAYKYPVFADGVRGTLVDPYHNDMVINSFISKAIDVGVFEK